MFSNKKPNYSSEFFDSLIFEMGYWCWGWLCVGRMCDWFGFLGSERLFWFNDHFE